MPPFVALQVNPNPETHTNDRQWAALHPSGIIMVSHGLQVPQDTPGQMDRRGGNIGSWSQPRWGWPSASRQDYPADVGRDLIVTDWTPDDLKGYVMDTFGSIWPFGSNTPYAAVGVTGAPFGSEPPSPLPIFNAFQMDSGNGLPFGLGGIPTGWGHLLSYYGTIYEWGGPGPVLTPPNLQLSFLTTITNPEMIQDFKLDSDTSHYYVLFASGFVFAGAAVNESPVVVNGAQPHGHSGNDPGGSDYLTVLDGDHRRWFKSMHVEFDDSIIAARINGELWGHALVGGQAAPAAPAPPPWITTTPYGWPDIAIKPYRSPTHFYLLSWSGGIFSAVIAGTVTLSGLTTSSTHTTTTRPTLSWTYTAQYGVTQKSYNVRVYPTSVTTAPGFVAGQNVAAVWISDRNVATANDVIRVDLTNGTAYKAYVRVTSAADTQSAWSSVAFTMAVPLPAAPSSCTTATNPGTYPSSFGTVNVTAGGSLPGGCTRQFQVSIGNGAWEDVIGAAATTSSTVTDLYPPTSVGMTYRVRNVKRVPAVIASAWTLSADTFLAPSSGQPPFQWFLIDVLGFLFTPHRVPIRVKKWEASTIDPRGEFQPLTRNAMVVTSAGVKGTVHNLTLMLNSRAEADDLWSVLQVTSRPLLFETQYGYRWWVSPRPGTWAQRLVAPTAYSRDVDVELVEVVRPT